MLLFACRDWIADELFILSAFIVDPVGLAQIGEKKHPICTRQATWLVEDWGCGLLLVLNIIKSLQFVRGTDKGIKGWVMLLASKILNGDWQVDAYSNTSHASMLKTLRVHSYLELLLLAMGIS